tara:strand:+ start:398 stop:619 length:222 start_codon:yes stop_codon:yes gene_type:complete
METIWIGDQEVAAEELTRQVVNDIEWLEEMLQDIQRELECKQELLEWLGRDHATETPPNALALGIELGPITSV